MSVPRDPKEAKDYYRAARQRLEEADSLLEAEFTTAAVYLAGYSIECITKSLLLTRVPKNKQKEMCDSFRGGQGHDIAWLVRQYNGLSSGSMPNEVRKAYVLANTWTTDLRYKPGVTAPDDAEAFVNAAKTIVEWADRNIT